MSPAACCGRGAALWSTAGCDLGGFAAGDGCGLSEGFAGGPMRLGGSCSTSAVRRSGRKQRRWSVDDCRGAGVSCVTLPASSFPTPSPHPAFLSLFRGASSCGSICGKNRSKSKNVVASCSLFGDGVVESPCWQRLCCTHWRKMASKMVMGGCRYLDFGQFLPSWDSADGKKPAWR